jgi:predicted metal-dependent enzyme (double-stranded beta helix superfamily)
MTTTAPRRTDQLERLADDVRSAIWVRADWQHTAELVADQLRVDLPGPEILTPDQRLGSPDGPSGHVLHVEPDGSFSITAVVWRPGQITGIHDHTTWCVFGVLQGTNREEIFDSNLNPIGSETGSLGHVNGFAPPGDIHRVANPGDEVAITLHIYGTDVTRIGSSARRWYDQEAAR